MMKQVGAGRSTKVKLTCTIYNDQKVFVKNQVHVSLTYITTAYYRHPINNQNRLLVMYL